MRTISDGSAQRWAPNGFSAVIVARSSLFSVSGRPAMSSSRLARTRPELLAVERGALEQVRDLRAVALGVSARTRPPSSPSRPVEADRVFCSSARWARRLAVRARIGIAFTALTG
jgi:hypothetical protein